MRKVIITALAGFIAWAPTAHGQQPPQFDPLTRINKQAAKLLKESHKQQATYEESCRIHGVPEVGMTRERLLSTCWGAPRSINTTQMAGGPFEQFVYWDGSYAYVDNGVVTAIQTHK